MAHPTGKKSNKVTASRDGLPVVGYGATGRPVGIEITAPLSVSLERLNQLLADLGETPMAEQDYKPVRAALREAGSRYEFAQSRNATAPTQPSRAMSSAIARRSPPEAP